MRILIKSSDLAARAARFAIVTVMCEERWIEIAELKIHSLLT